MTEGKIEELEGHVVAAAQKLRDLVEVHMPAIARHFGALAANPLVTVWHAMVPGEIGSDAMAILNGLTPLLRELGEGHQQPPAGPPPAGPAPASPAGEGTPGDTGTEGARL